ncbi:MAG TPA: EamA family transporter, partial [Xanthobacteraceae bacterium]|nr:EamA family transporter [Xanthobacteraceae bacterium]
MLLTPWLWAVFTLIAAAAQTVRNATQRSLTATLGTVGATHVRFLFGLPFAIIFLIGVMLVLDRGLPNPPLVFWPWVIEGAAAQFAATALMLAAMGERSFVVAIAYIKTEPVQVALFGLILLGDPVTWPMALAIVIATAGVVLMSIKPGAQAEMFSGGLRPTLLGLGAGALFGLSAIGFRGAILSLKDPSFVMAATFTLVVGLALQTVLLTTYLYVRDRAVLVAIFKAWRPSLFAGFMGALASQFW